MIDFEKNITITLNNLAKEFKFIYYFFRIFTFTGEWWMYISYAIITVLINPEIGKDAIKLGLVAYGLHYPSYYVIKNLTKRQRPFEKYQEVKALVNPPDKYSLPSGHSSGTMISALITTSFFDGLSFLFFWPIIVGLSRVFLGVHFVSDTIIGLILGFSSFYIANTIVY
tara:strand:+ start:58 stop:564 length:507 start_codon:yes stop_codon:yes gene_type:complete